MNIYAWIVLGALLGEFALSLVTSRLNIRAMGSTVPDEFRPTYDDETYARSQAYTRTRTRFGLVHDAVSLAALLLFWQLGGFGWLDRLCRGAGLGPVPTGLLFIGALVVGSTALGLPFRIYATFVIEERFGFNRTTGRTFVLDRLKGLALGAVLGGALLAAVLFFFNWAGPLAWLWCWAAVTVFMLTAQFVAPTWIMPLSQHLQSARQRRARGRAARLRAVDAVPARRYHRDRTGHDGRRRPMRSSRGSATTSGIALFDTLIEKQTTSELVAIVAHEVGHYTRRHIRKGLTLSLAHTGLLFWLLSLFSRSTGAVRRLRRGSRHRCTPG